MANAVNAGVKLQYIYVIYFSLQVYKSMFRVSHFMCSLWGFCCFQELSVLGGTVLRGTKGGERTTL